MKTPNEFLLKAIRHFWGDGKAKVLDFGCGRGELVNFFAADGHDAYGCDIIESTGKRLARIKSDPYRLPYPDATFDVVTSSSVLEHAQNTKECFAEIKRVLKPGGVAMHLYPGKWFLPREPHIFVPLVNFFWPKVPTIWLAAFAFAGVRNDFQRGLEWKEVLSKNSAYCISGLHYRNTSFYRKVSTEVFGNCEWPMRFYIDHSPGGFPSLGRKLHMRNFFGFLGREFRMAFLLQRKHQFPSATM